MVHSDYLTPIFTIPDVVIPEAVTQIGGYTQGFDTIVVHGVSGLVIGATLAYLLKKQLCIVRKHDEYSHSACKVEGHEPERYIFVDDFISGGATLRHVRDRLHDRFPNAACVGVYLWHTGYRSHAWCGPYLNRFWHEDTQEYSDISTG